MHKLWRCCPLFEFFEESLHNPKNNASLHLLAEFYLVEIFYQSGGEQKL